MIQSTRSGGGGALVSKLNKHAGLTLGNSENSPTMGVLAMTASGGNQAFGPWVQLGIVGADVVLTGIFLHSANAGWTCGWQLGVGAAGAEQVISEVSMLLPGDGIYARYYPLPVPARMSAARLAFRYAIQGGNGGSSSISVQAALSSNLET